MNTKINLIIHSKILSKTTKRLKSNQKKKKKLKKKGRAKGKCPLKLSKQNRFEPADPYSAQQGRRLAGWTLFS